MSLSNFRNYREIDGQPFAEVDLTTGIWPFQKTRTVMITKESFSAFWIFVDTGRFTPGVEAETLARAYHTKRLLVADQEQRDREAARIAAIEADRVLRASAPKYDDEEKP